MGTYLADRLAAADLITEAGALCTFTRVTGGTFAPITDTTTGASTTSYAAYAVVVPSRRPAVRPGTPANLTVGESEKILIAAEGATAGWFPQDGDRVTWAGRTLTLQGVTPLNPDGALEVMWTAELVR